MKKPKIKYSDEPIGKVKIVKDFLPKPKDLVLKVPTTKVTLALTKTTVDFFKQQAATHHIGYQLMIRELLRQYAEHYSGKKE